MIFQSNLIQIISTIYRYKPMLGHYPWKWPNIGLYPWNYINNILGSGSRPKDSPLLVWYVKIASVMG